jgi:hypothetical protein
VGEEAHSKCTEEAAATMHMMHQHAADANRINKLTASAVLPKGWSKVSPGLWRHDNGEESRINPSSMCATAPHPRHGPRPCHALLGSLRPRCGTFHSHVDPPPSPYA